MNIAVRLQYFADSFLFLGVTSEEMKDICAFYCQRLVDVEVPFTERVTSSLFCGLISLFWSDVRITEKFLFGFVGQLTSTKHSWYEGWVSRNARSS